MGYFCIGSYTRVLLSCTVRGETQETFCPRLFEILDKSVRVTSSIDNFRQILGASQDLNPDWIKAARDLQPQYVARYFYQCVRPYIEDQKKELLVLGLKDIIAKDAMNDDIELGSIESMTKRQFLDMDVVPLTQVLADLFLYAVLHTDNRDQKKFVRDIKKTYCDQFQDRRDTIKIYEAEAVRPLKSLDTILRSKQFKKTFYRIYESSLGLKRPNHVRIYRVDADEFLFDYEKLEAFAENSIGYYLLSRIQAKEFIEDEEEARIYPEGIKLLKERSQTDNLDIGNILGELLLYTFMERELSAPRIMNLTGVDGVTSDGIYLLKLAGNDFLPDYQLVFGTSKLVGNLQSAIDKAFSKVVEIKNNHRRERRMVNPSALQIALPAKEAEIVKKIIIPDDPSIGKPGDGFGIFIGYTVDISDDEIADCDEYKALIDEKLRKDVEDNIDYIDEWIAKEKLSNYSFYIYLLPFNNVDEDKKEIMAHVLNPGGAAI